MFLSAAVLVLCIVGKEKGKCPLMARDSPMGRSHGSPSEGKVLIVHKHHVHLGYSRLFHVIVSVPSGAVGVSVEGEVLGAEGFSAWVIPGFSAVSLLPGSCSDPETLPEQILIPGSCSDTAGVAAATSLCQERQELELIREGSGTSSAVLDPPAEEVLHSQTALLLLLGSLQPQLLNPFSSHQLPG